MDFEKEYKRKALELIVSYIESAMASYSKEEIEARIKKALPEKESEDESIRKRLVEYFNGYYDRFSSRNNVNIYWEGLDVKAVIAWLEKQKEQKPAEWSEEDKVMLDNIIWDVHMKSIKPLDEMDDRSKYKKYEDFLKSLPERFNLQSKQEWSEEDEKKIGRLRSIVNDCAFRNDALDVNGDYCEGDYAELDDWLTSLRPSWRPSEEQMEALKHMFSIGDENSAKIVASLYEDLKSL